MDRVNSSSLSREAVQRREYAFPECADPSVPRYLAKPSAECAALPAKDSILSAPSSKTRRAFLPASQEQV